VCCHVCAARCSATCGRRMSRARSYSTALSEREANGRGTRWGPATCAFPCHVRVPLPRARCRARCAFPCHVRGPLPRARSPAMCAWPCHARVALPHVLCAATWLRAVCDSCASDAGCAAASPRESPHGVGPAAECAECGEAYCSAACKAEARPPASL
jgi:hypothetical protein